ncbi:RNA polymerase sigma factor [Olivibacter jilunii]|uniref:RNA polymerase sigma factor n=1 Tax=Olivibacter jilunii TaxID=985016 RepID=UPI0013EF49C6|nr:sigma-70 family RNA polymerase sigma factor [Olivibacter jilunii]
MDFELLDALKAGDVNAMGRLYRNSYKWLMVVALNVLGKDAEEEAKDILSDFFLEFWDRRLFGKINHPKALNSYLFRSVHNRCLDRVKANKTRQKLEERFFRRPQNENMPSNRLENGEFSLALDAAVNRISPMSAKVFKLAYLEDKSRQEIAEEMNISPNTVKNQLVKAVKILRVALKNFYLL